MIEQEEYGMSDYDPDKLDTEPLFRAETDMPEPESQSLNVMKMLMSAINEVKNSVTSLSSQIASLQQSVAVLTDRDAFSKQAYTDIEKRISDTEDKLAELTTKLSTIMLTLKVVGVLFTGFVAIGGYKLINLLSGATP